MQPRTYFTVAEPDRAAEDYTVLALAECSIGLSMVITSEEYQPVEAECIGAVLTVKGETTLTRYEARQLIGEDAVRAAERDYAAKHAEFLADKARDEALERAGEV